MRCHPFRSSDPVVPASAPRAGSAAASQKREPDGRFADKRRKRRRRKPSRGVIGPTWFAALSKLSKVRLVIKLERVVDRLEAEREGRQLKRAERVPIPGMKRIEDRRAENQNDILRALHAVRLSYHRRRQPLPVPERIIDEVRAEFGGHLSSRTLYRPPYVSAWGGTIDYLGRMEIDADPSAKGLSRWNSALLAERYFSLRQRCRTLLTLRREDLVKESNENGWEAW